MNQEFDTITELNTERFNTDEEVFLNLNSDTMTSDLSGGQETVQTVQTIQTVQQQTVPLVQTVQITQQQQQQQQQQEEYTVMDTLEKFDGDIMINVLGIVMALILIN